MSFLLYRPRPLSCRGSMVASEPLTRRHEDWVEIPGNHTITISPDNTVALEPIQL